VCTGRGWCGSESARTWRTDTRTASANRSLSFWNYPEALDGIEYRSRWDNDRFCFALFDRAADALDTPDQSLDLAEPRIFNPIFRLYDIGVI
jgi:hypothetical protein